MQSGKMEDDLFPVQRPQGLRSWAQRRSIAFHDTSAQTSLWRLRRWLHNTPFEVVTEKLPAPWCKSILFALNNNPCQYNICNDWRATYLHVLHRVLDTGGTLDPHSKKKLISGAVRLCEGSEVCSEGVAGQVEVAEPGTGSTLMGETGRGASSTCPSLYLTLPLVFPLESGGLPDSHCSPGKVQHSGCSPGGLW